MWNYGNFRISHFFRAVIILYGMHVQAVTENRYSVAC